MRGADIVVAWVDSTGQVTLQDRYAESNSRPIMDTTSQDWTALQGREQNGWTAIQMKRLLDTRDRMDVPIKSGTTILIVAYGMTDLDLSQSNMNFTYHGERRYTRILPLLSYADPPSEKIFDGLETLDFHLNQYVVPSNDTTYYCQVFKVPERFLSKHHAFAHKILLDSDNIDLVHHLDFLEADPSASFDDEHLPAGLCDNMIDLMTYFASNFATAWAVGGDLITEYPVEAGLPIGGDHQTKYYMIQIHYDNPRLMSNRHDSSGIRFYIGDELRENDLGFLTFGTGSSPSSIAVPPQVERFSVDSFCPSFATRNFPRTGINVIYALPHTHLQGVSVWTKIIRNNTAVDYLFNAESYHFNYQFQHRLTQPIRLFPGDAFATRCLYSTMDKNDVTLGGEKSKDEMCLNMFIYYPRMNDFYTCRTLNAYSSWQTMLNTSETINEKMLKQWLESRTWTSTSAMQFQNFYDQAARLLIYGRAGHFQNATLPHLPSYHDQLSNNSNE